jgi:hypothetical protein
MHQSGAALRGRNCELCGGVGNHAPVLTPWYGRKLSVYNISLRQLLQGWSSAIFMWRRPRTICQMQQRKPRSHVHLLRSKTMPNQKKSVLLWLLHITDAAGKKLAHQWSTLISLVQF